GGTGKPRRRRGAAPRSGLDSRGRDRLGGAVSCRGGVHRPRVRAVGRGGEPAALRVLLLLPPVAHAAALLRVGERGLDRARAARRAAVRGRAHAAAARAVGRRDLRAAAAGALAVRGRPRAVRRLLPAHPRRDVRGQVRGLGPPLVHRQPARRGAHRPAGAPLARRPGRVALAGPRRPVARAPRRGGGTRAPTRRGGLRAEPLGVRVGGGRGRVQAGVGLPAPLRVRLRAGGEPRRARRAGRAAAPGAGRRPGRPGGALRDSRDGRRGARVATRRRP
ncbi:MAG: hypothetical protein AVDCRST_MAG40-210, partial [uncultured Gemmatimonadaceae bacterium]